MQAVPVDDTFPDGQLPDLDGLIFDIHGYAGIFDELQQSTGTCTTSADDGDDGATCPESDGPGQSRTWIAGANYRVRLDPESTPPANTIIPAVRGQFPDCTQYTETDLRIGAARGDAATRPTPTTTVSPPETSSGCPDVRQVFVYGRYRRVAVHVSNKVTGLRVPGVTYALCSPTTEAPQTGGQGCPDGSEQLATATTDENGYVVFPGLYAGSANYSIAPIDVPHGYFPAPSFGLDLPDVTKARQAGRIFTVADLLRPRPPVLPPIHVVTHENTPIDIDVFAQATAVSPPLTLLSVADGDDGSTHDPHATVTYTPDTDFLGRDTFTYRARNALGGRATGTVYVRVVTASKPIHPTHPARPPHHRTTPPATPPVTSPPTTPTTTPSTLPFTGTDLEQELAAAVLALDLGALLMWAGRRRRPRASG